jgi:hypothetical protein
MPAACQAVVGILLNAGSSSTSKTRIGDPSARVIRGS